MSRVSCLLRFSGSQYWGVLKLEVNMNFGKKQNQFKTLQVIYQSLCLAGGIAMLGSLLFQDIFATIPGLFRGPSSSEEHLNLIWLTNSELTGYSQIHWGFYSYSWIIFQILNTYVVIKKHWYIFLLTFTKKLTKCRYLTPCCDLEAWPCFGGFFSPKNKRHLQVPGKKKQSVAWMVSGQNTNISPTQIWGFSFLSHLLGAQNSCEVDVVGVTDIWHSL